MQTFPNGVKQFDGTDTVSRANFNLALESADTAIGNHLNNDERHVNYVVATGTNTYVVTLSPAITAYTTGLTASVKVTNANTGAVTINCNGLGAKSIKKNATEDLVAGDIKAGQVINLTYDGTVFQLTSGSITDTSTLATKTELTTHSNNNLRHVNYATSTGTNSYVVTLAPAITAYELGLVVTFKVFNANTGAVTLNCNGLGGKVIYKDGFNNLVAGDLVSDQVVTVVYDGFNFQLQGSVGKTDKSYVDTQDSALQTQLNAIVGVKTATITTTWTGASAPFTQVVNVTGVTANDEPIISPIYSATNATAILERTAWNLIGSAVTGAGTITFTCFETKPTTAITVQIKGV